MVKHFGRLKAVVRRKEGKCGYHDCSFNREIVPGDTVLILTKSGSLPGRPFVIFYHAFHQDCIGPYIKDRLKNIKMRDGGRPSIVKLDKATKTKRKNWLHERTKLIRSLKNVQEPEQLSRIVDKIDRISKQVEATGFPISGYGRRSKNDLDFDRFVNMMKERWTAPTDIKRRLETQVSWAIEQLASNGIVGKEEAIEAVLVEWQEEVNKRLELERAKAPTYEEVEERSLE